VKGSIRGPLSLSIVIGLIALVGASTAVMLGVPGLLIVIFGVIFGVSVLFGSAELDRFGDAVDFDEARGGQVNPVALPPGVIQLATRNA
jgi:type IV secretory pathway VirB2 component (pilin)